MVVHFGHSQQARLTTSKRIERKREEEREKQTARQRVRVRDATGESYPSRWLWLHCQGQ